MSIRLIALDMDGTLLGSDGQVSPRNRAALHAAEAHGIEIAIATGRRHAFAMKILRSLGLHPARHLISSNGTVIRTIGAGLVHRNHLPLSTTRWLLEELRDFRDTLVLTFDRTGADGEDTLGALVCEQLDVLHDSIGAWMQSNARYILQVPRFETFLADTGPGADEPHSESETPLPGAPIQAMLCGSVARMNAAEAHLTRHPTVVPVGQPEFPGAEITLHRTAYPERDLVILDILPAGCSKASALARVARLQGISMADTMAIGDNWNDLPMLREAGHPVLMGNAPPELLTLGQTLGWQFAPSNALDGVAATIEALLPQHAMRS